MDKTASGERTRGTCDAVNGITLKVLMRFVVFIVLMLLILFVTAGRLDWMMGWVYTAIFVLCASSSSG
jgi:cytosine/uracil/thiamine/allantoin permease